MVSLFNVIMASAQWTNRDVQERVATIKESIARNEAKLQDYRWTERTETLWRGRTIIMEDRRYRYGADGKIEAIFQNARGQGLGIDAIKGASANYLEQRDHLSRIVSLMHEYVPLSTQRIEASFQAGLASLAPPNSGNPSLRLKNYSRPGDGLVLDFDSRARALSRVGIMTYLENSANHITLEIIFQTLPDGTNYAAHATAAAQEIEVKVLNFDYNKTAR